jgi:hypothetical protein
MRLVSSQNPPTYDQPERCTKEPSQTQAEEAIRDHIANHHNRYPRPQLIGGNRPNARLLAENPVDFDEAVIEILFHKSYLLHAKSTACCPSTVTDKDEGDYIDRNDDRKRQTNLGDDRSPVITLLGLVIGKQGRSRHQQ